jgi:hypothetical protein
MKLAVACAALSILSAACSSNNNAKGGMADAGVDGGLVGALCGNVQIMDASMVPAGQTLTICAGSTVSVPSQRGITIQGTLIVSGTAASPVKFYGALRGVGNWAGLIVAQGGSLNATYLEIHDATVGVTARSGSAYEIDHILIDGSSDLLALASNGTVAHGTLHGIGIDQRGTPVGIDAASPVFTDTVVNNGFMSGIDMIVISGAGAAPMFDRMEVADSASAFTFSGGAAATISNSFIHHNAYGVTMGNSTASHIVGNNFQDNGVNIGACTVAGTEVKDNYFAGAPFDDTCNTWLKVTGTTPATPYTTGVGPMP